jgi:proline iminopeptidase
MGFYRLQYSQSASAPAEPDLRPAIAGNRTPTLIVKGACDYLSWSSAIGWRTVLPRSQLIYLRGGHNVYQDAPGEVLASVRAFLADRPLPVAPYPGDAAPEDYEGPP